MYEPEALEKDFFERIYRDRAALQAKSAPKIPGNLLLAQETHA
jgi:hypothetical protein